MRAPASSSLAVARRVSQAASRRPDGLARSRRADRRPSFEEGVPRAPQSLPGGISPLLDGGQGEDRHAPDVTGKGGSVEAAETIEWQPLGSLLRAQGLLTETDVEEALEEQERSGERLGAVLLGRGLLSRPLLTRLLAEQRGSVLEQETGFGTGLRAEIERRHRQRLRLRLASEARR